MWTDRKILKLPGGNIVPQTLFRSALIVGLEEPCLSETAGRMDRQFSYEGSVFWTGWTMRTSAVTEYEANAMQAGLFDKGKFALMCSMYSLY